jgi:hypothetical protein
MNAILSHNPSVSPHDEVEESGFFSRRPMLLSFTLTILFIASFCIRVYRITDPPLDFYPVRQYFNALRVRSYYYAHVDSSAPQWMREVAEAQSPILDVMEPPILDGMTLLLWWLFGGVYLWIPRLLTCVFWLVGGVVLYLLTRRISSTDAAVVSTGFYLLLPYAVFASRTFMRDPLLVMMLLCSIFTIVRYHEQPTMPRVVSAGIVAALAMFIKPISTFMIFGAFVSLAIYREGLRKSVLNPRTWLFVCIALPVAILFHGYPLLFLGWTEQAGMFARPEYLLDPLFYRYWLAHLQTVVGFGALIVALLGVPLLRQGTPRRLVSGMWFGYVVFGLVFTYHTRTHAYYHLQLIPLVALCLGPVGALVLARLDQIATRWPMRAGVLSVPALAMVLALGVSASELARQDFDHQVRTYEEVGEAVHHSMNTVFLTEDYGYPLEYYGWLHGKWWPCVSYQSAYGLPGLSDVDAKDRFLEEYAGSSPEYFIITNFEELDVQPDLRSYLTQNFPIAAQTEDYLVFDLRRPVKPQEENRYQES